MGLVDDLLRLCPEQGLQFEWGANQCRVRSLDSEPHELIEVSLTKSVFRAMRADTGTEMPPPDGDLGVAPYVRH